MKFDILNEQSDYLNFDMYLKIQEIILNVDSLPLLSVLKEIDQILLADFVESGKNEPFFESFFYRYEFKLISSVDDPFKFIDPFNYTDVSKNIKDIFKVVKNSIEDGKRFHTFDFHRDYTHTDKKDTILSDIPNMNVFKECKESLLMPLLIENQYLFYSCKIDNRYLNINGIIIE